MVMLLKEMIFFNINLSVTENGKDYKINEDRLKEQKIESVLSIQLVADEIRKLPKINVN